MWPVFTYLTFVLIHTPTAKMYFYDCQNSGTVLDYREAPVELGRKQKMEYLVEMKCGLGDATRTDWLIEGNLVKGQK